MTTSHVQSESLLLAGKLRPRTRPLTASAVCAALLSVLLVAPTMAADWRWVPVQASDGGGDAGYPGGMAVLSPTTAVVITKGWGDPLGAFVRRSTNSGLTWHPPITLSAETNGGSAIAGHGSDVDAVWIDKRSDVDAGEVLYAHSSDAAASFSPGAVISSPATGYPKDVSVARGADGTVAIAWTTKFSSYSNVRIRVSHNSGATFGPPRTLAAGQLREVKLAVGEGVIYAVYIRRIQDGLRSLELRHSPDNGSAWAQPRTLATDLYRDDYRRSVPTITAEGDQAYVGWVNNADELWYRRTLDSGATWSLAMRLSRRLADEQAAMSIQDGVVRVAYSKCDGPGCRFAWIRFRRSSDGIAWSPQQKVSRTYRLQTVVGVGHARGPIILFHLLWGGEDDDHGTYVLVKT